MSELQLSSKLVNELTAVLVQHDASANDPGIASQYLCAIVGFLLGQQQGMSASQRAETIENLGAFISHVADDVAQQSQQPPPPPPQDAFGIWKPKS